MAPIRAVHIRGVYPNAARFDLLKKYRNIRHTRYGHIFHRTRRSLADRRRKAHAAALRDDNAVRACAFCRSEDRAEVMRVGDLVAHNDKRRLVSAFRQRKNILHLGERVHRRHGDDALVVFAAAHAVQLTGIHFLYRDARLLCHAENRRYRAVFLPAPHKDAVNGSARFKRLRNGIAPRYDISFSFVFHEQTFSFPRLQNTSAAEIRNTIAVYNRL